MADIETVVVGAGVVGLAIARELASSGHEVMVLERNNRIGAETSSRNSEVIHAGLYYPPGSLRAQFCVDGRDRLYRFAAENGVAAHRCGKLVVATEPGELDRLSVIAATARQNGVGDLQRLSAAATRELEPEVSCVGALLSPSTGIIDSHGLMNVLHGHIDHLGGQVVLGTKVLGVTSAPDGSFALETVSGVTSATLTTRRLVIAAGHDASRLGAGLRASRQGYVTPLSYPAKGHYFTLTGRAPFRHLVYPMPSGAWLGIHFTLDTGGAARFGPDLVWSDRVDYTFEDEGVRREVFAREIRRYWPGLPIDALVAGYTGVRPKIYPEGAAAADFAIHGSAEHGIDNLVALYGIESPGLTSCLSIAAHVARLC